MNELQTGLLALGGLAIVGIVAYNKWQERQHRKATEHLFQQPDEDVLLRQTPPVSDWREDEEAKFNAANERREPVFSPFEEEAQTPEQTPLFETPWDTPFGPPASGGTREDPFSSQESQQPYPHAAMEVPLPPELLLPGVDAIAALELAERVAARQILESRRELRQLKKPLHWVGFNEAQGIWEYLIIGSRDAYRHLRVGLQLADRRGPMGNEDFALFSEAMQQLADEFMATLTLPPSQAVLAQAQQLDKFCVEVDFQIGINLVACAQPFPGTKIRALAESAGMTLGVNGIYTRYDDNGMTAFSLQNFEPDGFPAETLKDFSTNALVFLLDVPRVPRGQYVYKQMVSMAKRFAETLNGILVDDNRQPLGEPQFEHICQEFVIKPQTALEDAGLPAGCNLALRLFN